MLTVVSMVGIKHQELLPDFLEVPAASRRALYQAGLGSWAGLRHFIQAGLGSWAGLRDFIHTGLGARQGSGTAAEDRKETRSSDGKMSKDYNADVGGAVSSLRNLAI